MKKCPFFLAALALLLLITGCVLLSSVERIEPISNPGEEESVKYLVENWNDFLVWHTGVSYGSPSAIIFDPKKDGRNLVAERWDKVTGKENLVELTQWLGTRGPRAAILYRILGPDNQVYGYMLSKRRDVHIRAINEATLWVDDFPPPNYGP